MESLYIYLFEFIFYSNLHQVRVASIQFHKIIIVQSFIVRRQHLGHLYRLLNNRIHEVMDASITREHEITQRLK